MKITCRDRTLDLASRTHIMGILNVTPDSFSDGGRFLTEEAALAQAEAMIRAGADLIDIGGESTRPYAEQVSPEEELSRVLPAIRAIRRHHLIPISIDTHKAEVARQALAAGADIINDISALRLDPGMVEVASKSRCPVIIMHMQGTPADMQISPRYQDVVRESIGFFHERLQTLSQAGIDPERIIIDPGIGFGKTLAHNLAILRHTADYQALGRPLLVGHSRKSFLKALLGKELPDRDRPTALLSALLAQRRVEILRVHDVAATQEAVRLAQALEGGSGFPPLASTLSSSAVSFPPPPLP